MRLGAETEQDVWRAVLAVGAQAEPAARLDRALALAAGLAEVSRCHLYLAGGDGRRLHLERTHGAGEVQLDPEGGAAAALPLPPLEIRADEDQRPRVVPTPEGSYFSLPLERGDELVGVLRAGPLPAGRLSRNGERRLLGAAFPLAHVIAGAQEAEELRRRGEEAETRLAVGRRLQGSALETGRFVALLLRLAIRASHADGGFVAIADQSGGLTLRAVEGLPGELVAGLDLSPQTGLLELVPGGGAFLRDADAAARLGIGQLLAVPLFDGERAVALLALVDTSGGGLEPGSLVLLETLAEQIRLMLDNEALFDRFVSRYLDTVKAIAEALDARRPETHGHHRRTAEVTGAIAAELGLPAEERAALETAALVHDVGLAGVAATADAYLADLEHPTVGAGMLEALPLAPGVVEAVEGHHEWFDGWGFPQGLRGERLHPLARVLALAEFVLEAGGGGPLGDPWPAERLATEIRERRGTQFDPEVADAALRLLDGGWRPHQTETRRD
ncbi:MAG TPA: HD domain-containing phosphohydrolase [Gaiellaceae bacterium]|nr:HD domain-containing phosphohydrolase [Gaiellaceae bacterium]